MESFFDQTFGGFLRLGPCFPVVETPECNCTSTESFNRKNPFSRKKDQRTMAYLFTPNHPNKAELLHDCGGKLSPFSTYDPNSNTEVIIHGWLDGVSRTAWMREMKKQLFIRGSYNVILVDWTWGNTPDYTVAAYNARTVGEQVGFMIKNIMYQTKCGPEKFHVIGHSFGAIAAGFVGRTVKGLRRITALDPAYAPFGNSPPNQRLTYRDAEIVDVIHSNGYSCFALGLGDARQLGHADFYPNGGKIQPSCFPYALKSILKSDILYGLASLVSSYLCNHLQYIQFYKLSINSKGCEFVGVASSSYKKFLGRNSSISDREWAVMGMDYEFYNQQNSRKGKKYFLKTLNNCPYFDSSYLGKRQFPFKVSCTE